MVNCDSMEVMLTVGPETVGSDQAKRDPEAARTVELVPPMGISASCCESSIRSTPFSVRTTIIIPPP